MNNMRFDALLFRLAIDENLVSTEVTGRIREMQRDNEAMKRFKPNDHAGEDGRPVYGYVSRVDHMRKQWDVALPVEKAAIRLAALESDLRGELQDALLNLELSAPGDIRDATKQAQALSQNPHPGALREATEFIRDAGGDTTDYDARIDALYPPDPEEATNA